MSVQTEIDRIKGNVAGAYTAVEEKGGSVPEVQNSENLPTAIRSIVTGTEFIPNDTLTLKDGVLGVSFPNRAITRAEYDALPEEEKMAEVNYIIVDDDSEDGGEGSVSLYEQFKEQGYSGTEEEFKALIASGPWLPLDNATTKVVTGLVAFTSGIGVGTPPTKITSAKGGHAISLEGSSLANIASPTSDTDAATKKYVDDKVAEVGSGPYYANCITAAGTAAKAAICNGFTLETGAMVAVTFNNANTAVSPTLNVNNTGAKYIKKYGTTSGMAGMWSAGSTVIFVYDGTYWVMVDGYTAELAYNAMPKSGGTFTGSVYAQRGTSYTTPQFRNIYFTTTDLTAGASDLNNGDIAIVYE